MELKEIQSLVKLISSSGVDELTVEKKDFRISIKKNAHSIVQAVTSSAPHVIHTPEPATQSTESTESSEPGSTEGGLVEVKSPMIGTFYRRPSPDKPNFVEVGDIIEQGKIICIIEAMKLFNEIESEIAGKIVKVLVDDSEPVEYDQPLFLVEPA